MTTLAEQRAHDKRMQTIKLVLTAYEANDEFPTIRLKVEGRMKSEIAGITAAIVASKKQSPADAAVTAWSRVQAAFSIEIEMLEARIDAGTATTAEEDLWLAWDAIPHGRYLAN